MLRVRDADDQAAFAELVGRFQHRLVAVMHHLIGTADEAEDLAQEVFLRVFRTRKEVHAQGEVLDVAVHDRQQPGAERPARPPPPAARAARRERVGFPADGTPGVGPRPPAGARDSAGRTRRRRPPGARRAERAAARGRRAEQVRGHGLRRNRGGDEPVREGGEIAAQPRPRQAPRGAPGVHLHGRRRPRPAGRTITTTTRTTTNLGRPAHDPRPRRRTTTAPPRTTSSPTWTANSTARRTTRSRRSWPTTPPRGRGPRR